MSLVLEGLSIKLYNKMRKQTLVIAGIITALVGLGGFIYSASAALGGWGGMMSSEWRENLKNSYQNNDYNSWKNLMTEKQNQMMNWMTQERFSKMAEMRKLMQEGKVDEANKIRGELGLPAMGGKWNGKNKTGNWRGSCWR